MGAEAARPAIARPTTMVAAFWAKAEGKVKTEERKRENEELEASFRDASSSGIESSSNSLK